MKNTFIPETIQYCNEHFIPKVNKFITCKNFGNMDGMDGACHWCKEMLPYQWHMCSDEHWKNSLMLSTACQQKRTEQEAIDFIENFKQRLAKRSGKNDE